VTMQKGTATYLSTAVKLLISVVLGFLLYWKLPEIYNRSFIKVPMSYLQKSYGYSDNKPTYQNVVRDMSLCKTGTKPDLPDVTPAEYHEVSNPDVPSRPTNPTLTQQGTDLVISWSAPMQNGGAPILGYRIYIDGQLYNDDLIHDLSETIPGLSMEDHNIKITAINKAGEGPPVEAHFKLNAMIPGAPTDITATAKGRNVTVSWKAPASNGGTPVIGYNIYMNGVQQNQSPVPGTSYTVKNLSAGTYTFYIVTVNAIGPGEPSYNTSINLKTAPEPPTNVSITSSGQTVTVSWAAPQNNGGSFILGYNVYLNGIKQNSSLISGNRYILDGIKSGTYKAYVTAVNSLGESYASAQTSAVDVFTVPGTPKTVEGNQYGTDKIQVSWTAPDDTGNREIMGYNIYVDGKKINSSPVLMEGQKGVIIPEETYQPGYHSVSVSAVNSLGEGEAKESDPVYIVTIPTSPRSVTVYFSPTSTVLSWAAPESDGYSDIIEYDVYLDNVKQAKLDPDKTSYDLGMLSTGEHTLSVTAVNQVGESQKGSIIGIAPEQVVINAVAQNIVQGDAFGSVIAYKDYEVEIEAVPKTGYVFDHWELNGIDVSHNQKESVVADQSKTYYAVFRKSI